MPKKFAPTVNLNDPRVINVIGDFDIPNLASGKPSSVGGHISFTILKKAVNDCITGNSLQLLPALYRKFSWHLAGQEWAGHTELLAYLANPKNPQKFACCCTEKT